MSGCWSDGEGPGPRIPAAFTAGLYVAGVDDEAVEPGIEAFGVAKGRQVAPGAEQRLLGRVLGAMRVAEDPVGERIAAIDVLVASAPNASWSPVLPAPRDPALHPSRNLG